MLKKLTQQYQSEKIIRLIVCHILFLTLAMGTTMYFDYYFQKYQEKAQLLIDNQNNKRLLADIIQKELLLVESNYRSLILATNNKHLNIIHKDINDSIKKCEDVLDILENGGLYSYVQLVNFYDMDEINTEIRYQTNSDHEVPIEVIDLRPKLLEMKELAKHTYDFIFGNNYLNKSEQIDDYQFVLISKQMESMFLRCREIANKIYYDIKKANEETEQNVVAAREQTKAIIFTINLVANTLIIMLAIVIAIMISRILKKKKQASQSLNTILEHLPFGVFVVDMNKKIIKVNKTAKDIIGYNDDSLLGKTCQSIVCPSNNYCPVIDSGEHMASSERTIFDHNGNTIPVIKTAIPLELEGQKVLLEAFTDISEQKRMQELLIQARDELEHYSQNLELLVDERTVDLRKAIDELNDAQAQLIQSEKMASVGQLAAGIAHEINNPIGFVKNNLDIFIRYIADIITIIEAFDELYQECLDSSVNPQITDKIGKLKDELDIDYEIKDTVKLVEDSIEGVNRITRIITDLKEFSHVNNPDASYEDINIIMDKTISVAWNELKYKAEIIRDFGNLPLVNCYGGQIGQVFLNILVNASQAIEDSGKIVITTRSTDNSVIIEIADNGCGIPPEIISKIYDPFFTTKPVGKGTGLGLNLAYKIIESHHGRLSVESVPGKGTTFKIELPINVESEAQHQIA